jgi:hypothetical protein
MYKKRLVIDKYRIDTNLPVMNNLDNKIILLLISYLMCLLLIL